MCTPVSYTHLSDGQESYFEAVKGWLKKHHDWEVQENWLVKTPGIVMALALSVKGYTDPEDAVLIQSPVYLSLIHI